MQRKTILITGVSSGIGKSTALFFKGKGWNVAGTVRRKEDFIFSNDHASARNFLLDVTDSEQCQKTVDEVIDMFGSLDVLVNNAGLAVPGPFEESTDESIKTQMATNFEGPLHLTRSVLPHFRKQRQGMIITVSTIGGRVGVPFLSSHVASKFAVEGFFESLRFELFPFNIKVKIIEPGSYATRLHANGEAFPSLAPIPDYAPFLRDYEQGQREYAPNRKDPIEVARVIWEAATDGKNRLRYIVGNDAEKMDALRKSKSDEELFGFLGRIFLK